jgi:hypothetical protein
MIYKRVFVIFLPKVLYSIDEKIPRIAIEIENRTAERNILFII